MKACQIMHPNDAKVLQVLRRMDGLNTIIRIMMENRDERICRGENLGGMMQVTERTYPEVYQVFKTTVRLVGIKEPELYIYNDPVMNAYTYGETHPFIALSSSLVERLTLPELQSVIAHECGHILCKHMLYGTLLITLQNLGEVTQLITESLSFPVYCALKYWSRCGEYSADRCAAAVVGERTFQTAMFKLTCGVTPTPENTYQFVEQGHEYQQMLNNSWWNRIQQNFRVVEYSHPEMCLRALAIDNWRYSATYRALRNEVKLSI